MNFNHIEYFVTAAELYSMNKAAKKIGTSIQRLSAGINAFEKELGFSLLERTATGVRLTEQGGKIFPEAQKCLEYWNGWKSISLEKSGTAHIKFGVSSTLMRVIAPKIISKAQAEHDFTFDISDSYQEKIFSRIVDEKMIGVINSVGPKVADYYRLLIEQNGMEYEEGPDDPSCIFINSSSPLAGKEFLSLHDLSALQLCINPFHEHNFIHREIYRFFSHDLKILKIPQPENVFQLISMNPMMATVMPKSSIIKDGIWGDLIVSREIEDFAMEGRIWMIFPKKINEMEKIFIEIMKECIWNIYAGCS